MIYRPLDFVNLSQTCVALCAALTPYLIDYHIIVHAQVGQQITLSKAEGIFLPGSEARLLAIADRQRNTLRPQPDEEIWVIQMRSGSARHPSGERDYQ